jgi:hypothetical protein
MEPLEMRSVGQQVWHWSKQLSLIHRPQERQLDVMALLELLEREELVR